ncbi:hypothetical protein I4U23_027776 [Adineta vaga]|nr:hypothetical protein I4U23_027776 [Adineta vaga]
MQRMDSQQRVTLPEHVQTLSKEPFTPISINKNETNTLSGTPRTPISSNKSGWSWMSFGSSNQQSKQASNNSSGLDLSHITSRLMVMKTPQQISSDVSSRSTGELALELFDTKYPNVYMLYSLDQSSTLQPSYQKEFFHNRVLDLPLFEEKQQQPPPLIALLWFCQKVTSYLLESSSHVVILHCNDGKNHLAFATCLLFAYHKLYPKSEQIIQFYTHYRLNSPSFTMSQKRYIQYFCNLSHEVIDQPHFNELILHSISLTPIPLVNRAKTSCRPFIDIYSQDHKKLFSTYQETSKLRVYTSSESMCTIPVDLRFNGDLTIHITHATVNNSRRTHEGGVRICELRINSNFSTSSHPELSYLRNELDGIDSNEKNPIQFRVSLHITNQPTSSLNQEDPFLQQLSSTLKQPLALFQDENELKQKKEDVEKQLKNELSDSNDHSISPTNVIHRPVKPTDPISPGANNSPRNSNRFSGSFSPAPLSPSSSSSFSNPIRQLMEMNSRQSQIQSSKGKTVVDNLLGIDENISYPQHVFERSISSDTQQQNQDLLSSIDSQTDSNDGDIQSNNKPTFQRHLSQTTSLPAPITATIISQSKQKPTSKICFLNRCQTTLIVDNFVDSSFFFSYSRLDI